MSNWPASSDPYPPLEGQVHVWSVALNPARFDARSWLGRLSPQERERAQRFKFPRDLRRYVVAHVALREILAGYLNVPAGDLLFVDGVNGKPRLAPAFATTGIEFNLSHSHERALVAFARGIVIGIDLEFVKSDFGFEDVAERFFTPREVTTLHALPQALRRLAFYKCWTSKEAFLKARGTGLSGALDEVEIVSSSRNRVAIAASVTGWSLIDVEPGAGYEGALVLEGKSRLPIHRRLWQPDR